MSADEQPTSQEQDTIESLRRQLARSKERERETAKLLETVLANMSNGLVVFDADDRLLASNHRFMEMYGF